MTDPRVGHLGSALRAPAEGTKGTAASYQRHSKEREQTTRPLFPKRRKGWGICFARMKIKSTVILSLATRLESWHTHGQWESETRRPRPCVATWFLMTPVLRSEMPWHEHLPTHLSNENKDKIHLKMKVLHPAHGTNQSMKQKQAHRRRPELRLPGAWGLWRGGRGATHRMWGTRSSCTVQGTGYSGSWDKPQWELTEKHVRVCDRVTAAQRNRTQHCKSTVLQ